MINSVDKTKFLYTTSPPTQHHSFFRNYPFKYESREVIIPVEERTCLVCKENCIENEQHFLMYCRRYSRYTNVSDNDKTKYLITAENKVASKVIGKYIHLMFQKRKQLLNSQM